MRDELDIPMPRMVPAEPGYRTRASQDTFDTGTKRLAMIGGGLTAALLLIGGAWKLSGHRSAEVPVVHADSQPLRSKPDNAGGMQVEGQNDSILSGATDGKDSLAPPPEVPEPQALKDAADQLLAARQAAAPAAASPVQQVASPDAAPPAPIPAVATVPAVPAASPAAAHQPAPVHEAAAPAAPPGALAGHAAVQLAALGSADLAMVEWHRLNQKMPDLLGGREPSVQKIEAHGRTFWRLRTGGFADIAEATAFCQEVRAKGGGCTLARF